MTDLLAEGNNSRKQKLRLLLMGAMDSEVSDVITEFLQRRKGRMFGSGQGGDESRDFLRLASLVGIALTFFLLPEEDRARLDKGVILDHFLQSLEEA